MADQFQRSAHQKMTRLKKHLTELEHVLVAFSSGVDSTFLLKTAHDVLGARAIAVTARSPFFPARESEESEEFCRREGIRQIFIDINPLSIDGIRSNPPDRCYRCKSLIFREFRGIAASMDIPYVVEGTNMDDMGDYRPGLRALSELEIISPLKEAGLTKQEIRFLSKEAGLPTWNKPAYACLATRFAYGDTITESQLSMIAQAEQLLIDLGFHQIRVRLHGNMARIEPEPADIDRFMQPKTRSLAAAGLHKLGFTYVTLDLDGYQTGSMNKTIQEQISCNTDTLTPDKKNM